MRPQELPAPRGYGDALIREDFDRDQPPGLVWRDERKPDTWVLRLQDGRLLSLYGYRQVPWGIRGCLSRDGGGDLGPRPGDCATG